LGDLALKYIRIPNPQVASGSRPGEAQLFEALCDWFIERGIRYEGSLEWGLHAMVTSPHGAGGRPGVLLSAHLDSDNLDHGAPETVRFDPTTNSLRFEGRVGLDCKTGVAIALSVIERLRSGLPGTPRYWCVHVLFTIGEESGQKGAIRAPLPRLLTGRVRFAIVIDRMTSGRNCPIGPEGKPLRHAVVEYKGVKLLDSWSADEMMRHLQDGLARASVPEAAWCLPAIESPNCSDALELKGRWDAEVVAPLLLQQHPDAVNLNSALDTYRATTKKVRDQMEKVPPEERISSMNHKPRSTRYEAIKNVQTELKALNVQLDPSLVFGCVNISYDYQDGKGSCSLEELERTVLILLGFVASCFET